MKFIHETKVEGFQWFKNGDHPEDNYTINGEGQVVRYYRNPEDDENRICDICGEIMLMHGWIDNYEDGQIVCPGDWIFNKNVEEDEDKYYSLNSDTVNKFYTKLK